jgi:hypothetical protein
MILSRLLQKDCPGICRRIPAKSEAVQAGERCGRPLPKTPAGDGWVAITD